jgi:hypothetical protein
MVASQFTIRGTSSLFAFNCVSQFAHYYLDAAGEAVTFADAAGADAAGDGAGAMLAAGDGCGAGVGVASAVVDCKTECEPVTAGNESIKAMSMKAAAAPIVILDKMLAVPRGPNAVLETLLEKRSPAPDFPGCKSTTTTRTMHAKINRPYKM